MRTRTYAGIAACLSLTGWMSTVGLAQETLVHKVAEPFESGGWITSQYNKAQGSLKLVAETPPELGDASKQSLAIEASFSGQGFEFFNVLPATPLVIPGDVKTVSLWVRGDGQDYPWILNFKDGWGRSEAGGKKLEWLLSKDIGTAWKKITFTVPPDWVKPVTIDNITTHNWSSQAKKATARFQVDHLEVDTDIAGVDPQTGELRSWQPNPKPADDKPQVKPRTPLLDVQFTSPEEANVFSRRAPAFDVRLRSWQPGTVSGALNWKLLDGAGQLLKEGRQEVKVDSTLSLALPLDVPRFGLYRLEAALAWANGQTTKTAQPFARVPPYHELSDGDKDASPYGLNVHGGREVLVKAFRQAGIIWYRDYAFGFDWLKRAKGADKSYSGWPYYPRLIQQYDDAGVRVLACLMGAIQPPVPGAPGKPGTMQPDRAWIREMADIVNAFPQIQHWELDNEYDLGMKGQAIKEEPLGWKNYRNYHQKFGEIVHLLGAGEITAVEQGRAGIWPERVREGIAGGEFASIDVVNSHHYTGVDAPEVNVVNSNVGIESPDQAKLFFDELRAVKAVAQSDGKPRQSWLTEFGWDTLAGKVVTPYQQAAYLPRGYMLALAAGTEKSFWFFDVDAPNPKQFFDGCGLLTHDHYPKLSFCSFAGLTQILPKPEFVGTLDAGEGTWGYLFRNEGQLVAALWSVEKLKGPTVTFDSGTLYDYLANPIAGKSAALELAPVYAVGVAETDRWYRQSAYSIESPYLVTSTAGDTVTATLRVHNNRRTPINATAGLSLPEKWEDKTGMKAITVAPGQSTTIPLEFRVDPVEVLGEKIVRLKLSEGAPLKEMPLRVAVQQPLTLSVRGLQGEPGESDVAIRIGNRSAKTLSGNLRLQLPASWRTATPELKVEALKPGETREVKARVAWTPTWKEGESATVRFSTEDDRAIQQPLIPRHIAVHRAGNLVMDGDLKDWPATGRLPSWVLGSTAGEPNAAIYLAWSPAGLYLAMDVKDSKVSTPDPRSFWVGDVLELFVDTRDKKTARDFEPGDHQFWFVPQVEKGSVYAGQWKRKDEIAETKYDLQEIKGASRRTANGYVLEAFVPGQLLKDFKPQAGSRLGLNLNLTVQGLRLDREVYWPAAKSEGIEAHPEQWGSAVLAE